ncbi:MAG: CHAT domain-containing protein [Chitinophagaceae bacterium]|nr:MAG: CHAT domain-containing protein [Chitinophagaceae bacterium]
MVLKKIKSWLGQTLFRCLLVLMLLILFNIVHLIWYFVQPEGFWDFLRFLRTTIIVVFTLLFVIVMGGVMAAMLIHLFSDFRKTFTIQNVLKGAGIVLLPTLIFGLNFLQFDYLELKFYTAMADRYRYLEVSERMVSENCFEEALKKASQARAFAFKERRLWPVFLMTKYYAGTEDARRIAADKHFAAQINYAYCLGQFDGRLEESLNAFEEALALAKGPVLKRYPSYAIYPLTNLVSLHRRLGHLEKSEACNLELLQEAASARNEDLPYFINCQEELADYALERGDHRTAASIALSLDNLWREAGLGADKSNQIRLSLRATNALMDGEEWERAGQLLYEVSDRVEKRKKKKVFAEYLAVRAVYLELVATKGVFYQPLVKKGFWGKLIGAFEKKKTDSEVFLEEAGNAWEKALERTDDLFGSESAESATLQLLVAGYYIRREQPVKALALLDSRKADNKQGEYAIPLALTRHLAVAAMGKVPAMGNEVVQMEQQLLDEIRQKAMFLTGRERESYFSSIQGQLNAINQLLLIEKGDAHAARIYNNLLTIRDLALQTENHVEQLVNTSPDTSLRSVYDRIRKNRLSGGLPHLLEEKTFLGQLRQSPGYRPFDPRAVSWEQVRDALPPGSMAITYFTSSDRVESRRIIYALALERGVNAPRLVRLVPEANVLELLGKGIDLRMSTDSMYGPGRPTLRQYLIEPLISGATTMPTRLFIAPYGSLYQVAFPALLADTGIEVEILRSPGQVVEPIATRPVVRSAVIFSGVDYGVSSSVSRNTASAAPLAALPYSIEEGAIVGKLLRQNGYTVILFTKKDATEQQLHQLSGRSPHLLHLAIHGAFDEFGITLTSGADKQLFQEVDGMNQSKLFFTSSNSPALSTTSYSDGIISAADISAMDLRGTHLVVLSACESGRGVISPFEGVQGFTRAFARAGVRYSLVSLWNVPDKQTALLMEFFYEELLKTNSSETKALNAAQKRLRAKYPSPFYWAGFVLVRCR